ncbi:hypothetical protein niasHT_016404 [Heterodera trifolii]|uniref:SCP domain-containing protein n=1 Tax=Heterodera trifolii TaxID=157864 RepID=A0ABD2KU96_9BILA
MHFTVGLSTVGLSTVQLSTVQLSTVRLSNCPIVHCPIVHCPIVQLSYCPLSNCPLSDLTIYRSQLALGFVGNKTGGNKMPNANNMYKLQWDNALAKFANEWANNCTMSHSWNGWAGENLAMNGGTFSNTVTKRPENIHLNSGCNACDRTP